MKDREPRRISRRTLLEGALASLVLLACTKSEVSPTSIPTQRVEIKTAQQIRQEIKAFIDANPDNLSDDAIRKVFQMELDLYKATFGRPITTVSLEIVRNENLQPGSKPHDYPFGQAGYIESVRDSRGNLSVVRIIAAIAIGRPENYDPNIGKLQVMDALLKHELVHTQTNPILRPMRVKVGDLPEFTAQGSRGLKWLSTVVPGNSTSEYGYFFDEINTQFLAEYVNDPTGKDGLYQKMANSPFQKRTINPTYTEGAGEIARIYKALGIASEEVQRYHYSADPKGLLEKIDALTTQRGIKLPVKPSSILLIASPGVDFKDLHLPSLKELGNSLGK